MTETVYSDSFREITFTEPTDFDARGSSGYIKVSGVTLLQMVNDEVHIGCVTSRGRQTDSVRIPIPKSSLTLVGNALLQMARTAPTPGREVTITPAQAEAAKTLISIAVNASGEHADLEQTLLDALDADRILIKESSGETVPNGLGA